MFLLYRSVVEWQEVGNKAVALLFANLNLANNHGPTKFLVMAAMIEFICINFNFDKNKTQTLKALKLILSHQDHGSSFSKYGKL